LIFQIDPSKYKSITSGFGVLLKEQGVRGFFRGWVPTLLGYSAQGACKFGFYEFFKKYYSDMAGPEYAAKYKTLIYLAGSASAELIADVALCPMEAVKVRVQTQPGFARGLADGMPKFLRSEGYSGYDTGTKNLSFCDYLVIFRARYKLPNVYLMNECSMLSGYIKGLFLFGDVRFHVSRNMFSKRICLFKVKNVADDQNWYISCRYNDEICVL
jgi:hypothetical protein